MAKGKSEFEKFSDLTSRVLSVSKEELNRREAEWKKQRQQEKNRKAKKPIERDVSRDSGGGNA